MRLDRFITLNLVRPLLGLRRFGPGTRRDALGSPRTLPILMYHSISDDPEPGLHPYFRNCTSPRRFAEQMQWLKENGYQGVTLTQGLTWLNESPAASPGGEGPGAMPPSALRHPRSETVNGCPEVARTLGPQPVVLTFDDGFRDFHTEAFPILRPLGFSATMFLATAFIGETRRTFRPAGGHRASTPRNCLTWSEVRELHAAGIEFGSHTVNHPKLVDLDWPAIDSELRNSKLELESHLGAPVRTFAYPYACPPTGSPFSRRFESLLAEVGYTSNATTLLGREANGFNPFRLHRLPVNSDDDPAFLAAKLTGDYSWLGFVQRFFKRIKR